MISPWLRQWLIWSSVVALSGTVCLTIPAITSPGVTVAVPALPTTTPAAVLAISTASRALPPAAMAAANGGNHRIAGTGDIEN